MTSATSIEVEYKFPVKNKAVLIAWLDDLTRDRQKRQYQKNVMFDNGDKLMQKTNGRVRVRTIGQEGKKVLTYKKPLNAKDGAKRELEYEIDFVDLGGQIEMILEAMDFKQVSSYERYRTGWRLGNTCITLDECPFGDFVEIEGPKKEIHSVAVSLGFDPKRGLTKPIDTLFQEWRKKRGLTAKAQMRFDDFDK